jgi:hypothetical protein
MPRAPGLRVVRGAAGAVEGVVGRAQHLRREGQRLQQRLTPARQHQGPVVLLHVGRRHQQRTGHAPNLLRVRGPGRHQVAAERMRGQQHRPRLCRDRFLQLHHPVATLRCQPVMLLYADVAKVGFPQRLPMPVAAVLPAGQQQHGRVVRSVRIHDPRMRKHRHVVPRFR